MLLQLLPEQVSENWDSFRPYLVSAMAPHVQAGAWFSVSLLRAILSEKAMVWGICQDGSGEEIDGLILTSDLVDPVTGVKNMLVYSLVSTNPDRRFTDRVFKDALNTLRDYARPRGYSSIVTFTTQEKVVRMAQRIGGTSDVYTITFGLEDTSPSKLKFDTNGELVDNAKEV